MKLTKLFLTFLCSTLFLCACSDPRLALKVNDTEITKAEFNKIHNKEKRLYHIAVRKSGEKSRLNEAQLRQKTAKTIIKNILVEQEYKKRNITASEAEIKQAYEDLEKKMGSKEGLAEALKEKGIDPKHLDKDLINSIKMDKLIKIAVNPNISDSEIEAYYKKNTQAFSVPERRRVSQMLFKTNYGANKNEIRANDKQHKLSAEEVDKMAREETEKNTRAFEAIRYKINPKNFAQMAISYSQDPETAPKGGDMGYMTSEGLTPIYIQAIFRAKPGSVSTAVNTPKGSEMFYIVDTSAAMTYPLESVKADIKVRIFNEKREEFIETLFKGLVAKSKIEYHDKSLQPDYKNPILAFFANLTK